MEEPASIVIELNPPPPPNDFIQSALFIPLSSITQAHVGRKVRTIGQSVAFLCLILGRSEMSDHHRFCRILAFNPSTSLLLLTAPSTSSAPTPIPTLLINITTPLLGQSPASTDLSNINHDVYSRVPKSSVTSNSFKNGLVNRERLRLDRGEWVMVVGWLETDARKIVRKVSVM